MNLLKNTTCCFNLPTPLWPWNKVKVIKTGMTVSSSDSKEVIFINSKCERYCWHGLRAMLLFVVKLKVLPLQASSQTDEKTLRISNNCWSFNKAYLCVTEVPGGKHGPQGSVLKRKQKWPITRLLFAGNWRFACFLISDYTIIQPSLCLSCPPHAPISPSRELSLFIIWQRDCPSMCLKHSTNVQSSSSLAADHMSKNK